MVKQGVKKLRKTRFGILLVLATLFAFSAASSVTAATAASGFGGLLSVEGLVWAFVAVMIGIGIALLIIEILALFIPGIRKWFGGLI